MLITGLFTLASFPTPSWGGETGADLIYNRTDRYAVSDLPDSVDSSILRIRQLVFWKPSLGQGDKLRVIAEQEDYSLQDAGGNELIQLGLTKVHPRLRVRREDWTADVGLLAISIDRGAGVYGKVSEDDTDTFLLPALIGEMIRGPLSIRLGYWREFDILPRDGNLYSLIISRNLELSGEWKFSPDMSGRLAMLNSHRIHPAGLELNSTDLGIEFRWANPLSQPKGDTAVWREAGATLYRKHYPSGDRFLKGEVKSVFRLAGKSATHFIVPKLTLSDSIVVYDGGAQGESLNETTLDKWDLSARLEYEGFTRLGSGPYYLAWGSTWAQSLVRGVQRTLIFHVKVTLTY